MSTLVASRPVKARPAGFVADLFAAVLSWNDARMTRKALTKLTDRELDDIGLCRGDIDAISGRF